MDKKWKKLWVNVKNYLIRECVIENKLKKMSFKEFYTKQGALSCLL